MSCVPDYLSDGTPSGMCLCTYSCEDSELGGTFNWKPRDSGCGHDVEEVEDLDALWELFFGEDKPWGESDEEGRSVWPGSWADLNCKVVVKATRVYREWFDEFPAWHTYVAHESDDGTEWTVVSAGPSGLPLGSTLIGTLSTTRTEPDPSAPSVTVASGVGACTAKSCLLTQMARINAAKYTYDALGPSSNTYTRSLLSSCGLSEISPVSFVPGWNYGPI